MGAGDRFGTLLRSYRLAAGLSQQELAERAGLSTRAISDLERGARRAPYPATRRRLAEALEVDDADRARLLDARGVHEPVSKPPERQAAQNDLPRELNAFVGREAELAELNQWLADAPLVTIAGPGGAGKTRLALHLARDLLEAAAFADGITLVELAAIADARLVTRALADALGISERGGRSLDDLLRQTLRHKHVLLILDNCEHLVAVCAEIASDLLRSSANLRVLATSREPLRIAGERVYRIPPLPVPADDAVETLTRSAAARLFLLRARDADARFALTESNAPAIAEVCRRLDGLPLAIELAAARVATFAPAEIAHRLDDALRLVADGPRSAPTRHQTLEGAMSWSYALLDDPERRLFEYLSVFAGGFTLAGAQSVAPNKLDVDVVLSGLVAKSMVQVEPQPDGGVRYRLLEPLRQFGYACLDESGATPVARRAHVEFVLSRALPTDNPETLAGPLGRERPLIGEAENVRAALDWALATGDAELAARLGAGLWLWWTRPDRQSEGRAWLEQILAMPGIDEADPARRGRVQVGLAWLARAQGDMADAERISAEVEHQARVADDTALRAVATSNRSAALAFLGESELAQRLVDDSIPLARAAGLHWVETLDLGTRAALAISRGDLIAAEQDSNLAVQVAQQGRDPWASAMALNSLGDLMRARGDTERAGPFYEEARALFVSIDPHRNYEPQGLVHNLAYVALARGEVRRAADLFVEGAEMYLAVGSDRRGLAECIVGLGRCAVDAGNGHLAARLFGAAEAELERLEARLTSANRAEFQRGVEALQSLVGASLAAAGRADGRELSLEAALEEARVLSRETEASEPRRASTVDLTPREYEVAALVARGRSNRQIADALVITEKTAKNHVARILDKLSVHSRTEVAARAEEFGLR